MKRYELKHLVRAFVLLTLLVLLLDPPAPICLVAGCILGYCIGDYHSYLRRRK